MPDNERIERRRISASIDLKKLERESNRWLYLGTVVGVLLHVLIGMFFSFEIQDAVIEKHIPISLVFIRPAIQNPYENWKRVIRKKQSRRYQPETVIPDIVQPSRQKTELDVPLDVRIGERKLVEELPDNVFDSAVSISPRFELPEYFESLTTKREHSLNYETWDDLVTLGMMDSLGLTLSMMVIDPNNKKNLKGFVHIPAYINELRPDAFNLIHVLPGMSEAFEYYTGVKFLVERSISLEDPQLMEFPFIYITLVQPEVIIPAQGKIDKFGDYIRHGGFAVLENGTPWEEYAPPEASLINLLYKALGDDIEFRPIPPEHLIFHSFYDFNGMLPKGYEDMPSPLARYDRVFKNVTVPYKEDLESKMVMRTVRMLMKEEVRVPDWKGLLRDPNLIKTRKLMKQRPNVLWGVWLGDRMVALYSDKGYGHMWKFGIFSDKRLAAMDNNNGTYDLRPQMEMGVNIFMYALYQSRGKTQRFLDASPDPAKTARLRFEEKMDRYMKTGSFSLENE